jgi:integrase
MRKQITKRTVDALQPGSHDVYLWDTEIPGFGLKLTPRGSRIYLLKYEHAGRQRRYRLGLHGADFTPDQARERARRLRTQVADGGDPFAERERERGVPTMAEYAEIYMTEHAAVRKKASSAAEDRRNLDNHVIPLLGALRVSVVTPADIARMARDIANGKTSCDEKIGPQARRIVRGGRGAANRSLALVSKMLSLAEAVGHRPQNSNPCTGVERFPERKRQRFLTGEELSRLGETFLAAERDGSVSPTHLAAIRLLLFTGCRVSEITALRWADVDIERALLNLPDSKTGAKTVFLAAPALHVLAALDRPADVNAPVFPAMRRRRIGDAYQPIEDLRAPWGRLRRAAGLPDVRMHDLRHTFASAAAAGGISLQLIGGLLGHASTRTTERYAHLIDSARRDAVERTGESLSSALRKVPRRA